MFISVPGATPLRRGYERFGLVSGPIFLELVSCTGKETSILDCPHGTDKLDCDHTMDAGVQCYGMSVLVSLWYECIGFI